ncbi:hypothetical protein F5B17DRAFT_380101 [Nemania serpens]|nr:hypothetical protein F5B17DRAFT_380101 [Nemania serpens]
MHWISWLDCPARIMGGFVAAISTYCPTLALWSPTASNSEDRAHSGFSSSTRASSSCVERSMVPPSFSAYFDEFWRECLEIALPLRIQLHSSHLSAEAVIKSCKVMRKTSLSCDISQRRGSLRGNSPSPTRSITKCSQRRQECGWNRTGAMLSLLS